MNFQSDFEQMSAAELEAQCQGLRTQANRLAAEQQRRENDLQQAQNLLQQIRLALESLIEELVAALLPDLSATTLAQLAVIFPNESNLSAPPEREQAPEQPNFWQQIISFWRGGGAGSSAAKPLDQRRILLRTLLWQLSAVPAKSGNHLSLFRALVQKKQEFLNQEALVRTSEIAANQAGENTSAALESLSACERAIARRRRNIRFDDEDDEPFRKNRSPFDSSPVAHVIPTDLTNFGGTASDATTFNSSSDDSDSSTASSLNDFSFGGGGDAAGGGAGGSWENYS